MLKFLKHSRFGVSMPTDRIGNLDTARVAKIMSAAMQEFAASDYDGSSFNRIIKACGISKGTMYYYFKSKEDLYLTILKACSREYAALKQPMPLEFASSSEFWLFCEQKLTQLYLLFEKRSPVARFIESMLCFQNRAHESPSAEAIKAIELVLSDYIIVGQITGAIRKDWPIELTLSFLWSYWETVNHWYRRHEKSTAQEKARLLLDLMQRSLQPERKKEQLIATPISSTSNGYG